MRKLRRLAGAASALDERRRMRGCGEEISKTVTDCVSGRQPAAHAVSPEPRPTTATSRGAGWTRAGSAPSTVWTPPKGSQLLPLPLTESLSADRRCAR